MKFDTENKIIRWVDVPQNEIRTVTRRLSEIQTRKPNGIPEIEYGWTEKLLWLKHSRITGIRLRDFASKTNHALRYEIRQTLSLHYSDLLKKRFVHGDLSPSNILIDVQSSPIQVWCIDWLENLESYAGTPRYASKEVFLGHHSSQSDFYALQMTCAFLSIYR